MEDEASEEARALVRRRGGLAASAKMFVRTHILSAGFVYANEYLGNGSRLVITPLTDRIYVTATQALNLHMGCAPAGPAGTGKTETTKDLGSQLGKAVYVFNCGPELNYKGMANIFKGLGASGAWGCFDEFNRLIPATLSVCSDQFRSLCDGMRRGDDEVVIEGDKIGLDGTSGAFITMNPGYLGRSELPEGLKALFRPITVMVPDLVLICENMLMAEGFEDATVLARKFYGLYSLLRELLSKQLHYDWGLRAVKSVLVVAGGFKRAEPELPEQDILMRALRDFNQPKIVRQDEHVFHGLLGDLFPGVEPVRRTDEDVEAACIEAAEELGLNPAPEFIIKAVQLEELLGIRHSVFVMSADAGAGKSSTWKVLARARSKLGRPTTVRDLNPKALSPKELYGYTNMQTKEWHDGLMGHTMRTLGDMAGHDPRWIVLDGDLDANWIESMNSVMDDNKMLTLPNNERIPLKDNMKMLFEIRDLKYASPATVSRAGIMFLSSDGGTQWRNIVESFVKRNKLPQPIKDGLLELIEQYVPALLDQYSKEFQPLVPLPEAAMLQTFLFYLQELLPVPGAAYPDIEDEEAGKANAGGDDDSNDAAGAEEAAEGRRASKEEERKPIYLPYRDLAKVVESRIRSKSKTQLDQNEMEQLEKVFVFAAVWAFGSTLAEKDGIDWRRRFSDWFRSTFKAVHFASRETVFDYWLNPRTGKYDQWKDSPLFHSVTFDSQTMSIGSITVPTPETCALEFWARMLVEN